MPVIDVSSVNRTRKSVTGYIPPVIGMSLNCVSDSSKPVFIRSLEDYYAKISCHDLKIANLLKSGYSIKALTTRTAPEDKRNIRLFSDDYCYPPDLSVIGEDSSDIPKTKFSQMSNSNTYAFEFTLPTDIVIYNYQPVDITSDTVRAPCAGDLDNGVPIWYDYNAETDTYTPTEDISIIPNKTYYYQANTYNARFLSIFQGNITGVIVWTELDISDIAADSPLGSLIFKSDANIIFHDMHNFTDGIDITGKHLGSLEDWLKYVLGLSVKVIDSTYICARTEPVSISYFTNLSDTVLEVSKAGNSEFYNLNRTPVLDFETKNSYYNDTMQVNISNVAGIKYNIKFLVDNLVLESYDYDGTKQSAEFISKNSNLVNAIWHKTDNIPTGLFCLSSSRIYKTSDNIMSLSKFNKFPLPFIVLSDDLIKDTKELDCFDTSYIWDNNIVRVSGEALIEDTWYPASYMYLLKFKNSDILGTIKNAKQIRGMIPDSNVPSNNVYTLDFLTLVYYLNGVKTSYINRLTENVIYSYIYNNLRHSTSISYLDFTKLVDSLTWMKSFNSYQVTRFEKIDNDLYINLEVTVDGFSGVQDIVNLSFTINRGD